MTGEAAVRAGLGVQVWNLQRKPLRDMSRILDHLDETLVWDSWSFQEIATVASDFATPNT